MNAEKNHILNELELARMDWLPHHRVAERANGYNGEANKKAAEALEPIDKLLDDLGAFVVQKTVEV